MKQFKTVLLAGTFTLATSMAFAQVGVGTGTSGGTALGTGSARTSGPTHLNSKTGADANVGGTRTHIGVDASGNAVTKKKGSTTTGSAGAGASVNGTFK